MKFLYCKKQTFNTQLYTLHLECAHQCNGVWQLIYNSIETKLNRILDTLYHRLNKKLDRVVPSPSYRKHTPMVQNYAAKHRPSSGQTSVNHYEFQSSTALYSLMMDRIYPKHVGVIFNFMYFKLLYNVDFNL